MKLDCVVATLAIVQEGTGCLSHPAVWKFNVECCCPSLKDSSVGVNYLFLLVICSRLLKVQKKRLCNCYYLSVSDGIKEFLRCQVA